MFTQFREMTEPLATFLGQIFGRTGMVLHGATAMKNRKPLVQRFQDDEAVPFFVVVLAPDTARRGIWAFQRHRPYTHIIIG